MQLHLLHSGLTTGPSPLIVTHTCWEHLIGRSWGRGWWEQVMAADMSVRLGWIDADLALRAKTLLERANLPTEPPEGVGIEKFKSLMAVSFEGF